MFGEDEEQQRRVRGSLKKTSWRVLPVAWEELRREMNLGVLGEI